MIIDFIYSSERQLPDHLASTLSRTLNSIPALEVEEVHGPWGTVALALFAADRSGFFENEDHVCIVIGNPMIVGPGGSHASNGRQVCLAQDVLTRHTAGSTEWPLDLSGPFAALVVGKRDGKVSWLTDVMAFIPLYERAIGDGLVVGSHVDAVASVGAPAVPDPVSVADFVLHGVVTYPFTFFEGVQQAHPAQVTTLQVLNGEGHRPSRETYWVPTETNPYASLPEAAEDLRAGVTGYIAAASKDAVRIAHFLSAGEDSRVVASLLGESWKAANRPDAYIFLDSLNREGRIAQTVADKVGSKFNLMLRPGDHYLVSADKMAALVGSGHQFLHAHSFPWAIEADLASYDAVFGGYSADAMLKGIYAAKHPILRKLPFLPQISASARLPVADVDSGHFSKDVLAEVNARRARHLQRVVEFRPSSALEWFSLWPGTMRVTMPNLYANRRLFRSHEPYMSLAAVKVGAAAPVAWKLNRRLFHKAFKPALVTTRWIPHADGRFPAMPWWANVPLAAARFAAYQVPKKLGFKDNNDGSWPVWKKLQQGRGWRGAEERYLLNETVRSYLDQSGFSATRKQMNSSSGRKCNLLQAGIDLTRHANQSGRQVGTRRA